MAGILALVLVSVSTFAQDDPWYFDPAARLNEDIPSPELYLGYRIGNHHTRYDRITSYFELLDELSDRTELHVIGLTPEYRPQLSLIISSKENLEKLDQIRRAHLTFSKGSGEANPAEIPLIIQLGYNVHGNEASAGEAALLTAYYLTASDAPEVKEWLAKAVILIEPVLNPDGRDRFANWVNMHKGSPNVAHPSDREHNEVWPGGRGNHYWFDLNRDWLPASQVESQNRLEWYHHWMPNIITDHHEMGASSTFFFEPTKPGSENPLVGERNYTKLNKLFAGDFARSLDSINSWYDSGRSFDNLYPGYGSTYGDLHGGLALLFEQASSRGIRQTTDTGLDLPFKRGIRNQFVSALTTVNTAVANREMLNRYQQSFYEESLEMSRKAGISGWVFGDYKDAGRSKRFCELLSRHAVDFYPLNEDKTLNGVEFRKGKAWVVPLEQPQYRMVKTLFEAETEFADSIFYDATAWALVYSYGLPFAGIKGNLPARTAISADLTEKPAMLPMSSYGYVFSWNDYNAPKVLYQLQSMGVKVRAAWEPFTAVTTSGNRTFDRGSILIPVPYQSMDAEALYEIIKAIRPCCDIPIWSLTSGRTENGPYLGNSAFRALEMPQVLMPVGGRVRSTDAGALWHLFDEQLAMPLVKPEVENVPRMDLSEFNVLLLPSGSYTEWSANEAEEIKRWLRNGGTLIAIKSSINWLIKNKMVVLENVQEPKTEDSNTFYPYNEAGAHIRKHSIGGIFVKGSLDLSHPLAFGYHQPLIHLYRNHTSFYSPLQSSTGNVIRYTENPLTGGFITKENLEKLKGSAALVTTSYGQGKIILFVDDPAFRGCWFGTNKLLFNAVFFGSNI